MDGVVNFNGTRMPGTGINYAAMSFGGSCVSNNSCHDSEAGEWRDGLNANGDGCADCHDAGTTGVVDRLLDQGGWPVPTKSGASRHAPHVGSPYVAGDGVATYHCTDCHGATADAGTHAGHKDQAVDVATAGTNVNVSGYSAGDKTCENACHAAGLGVVGKRWTDGALVCTDCHAGAYVGGGANAPASGLHAVTPSVTGNAHDGSWDADGADGAVTADCVTCHTATPTNPPAGHLNGTFDASVGAIDPSDPRVHLNASVGFVDAATPACGPNGGAFATCHGPTANNGDAGSWKRRWDAGAAGTDGTECENCHGGAPTDARTDGLDALDDGRREPRPAGPDRSRRPGRGRRGCPRLRLERRRDGHRGLAEPRRVQGLPRHELGDRRRGQRTT